MRLQHTRGIAASPAPLWEWLTQWRASGQVLASGLAASVFERRTACGGPAAAGRPAPAANWCACVQLQTQPAGSAAVRVLASAAWHGWHAAGHALRCPTANVGEVHARARALGRLALGPPACVCGSAVGTPTVSAREAHRSLTLTLYIGPRLFPRSPGVWLAPGAGPGGDLAMGHWASRARSLGSPLFHERVHACIY